jgi:hypothetical protein
MNNEVTQTPAQLGAYLIASAALKAARARIETFPHETVQGFLVGVYGQSSSADTEAFLEGMHLALAAIEFLETQNS